MTNENRTAHTSIPMLRFLSYEEMKLISAAESESVNTIARNRGDIERPEAAFAFMPIYTFL